jgi:VIT1/CCC1 family predicted Fe2+/Mn2+ transporter
LSAGGRAAAREKMVRRSAFMAAALVVLAFVFLISGHWILALVFALAGVAGIWAFRQIRAVR